LYETPGEILRNKQDWTRLFGPRSTCIPRWTKTQQQRYSEAGKTIHYMYNTIWWKKNSDWTTTNWTEHYNPL